MNVYIVEYGPRLEKEIMSCHYEHDGMGCVLFFDCGNLIATFFDVHSVVMVNQNECLEHQE